MAKKVIAKVSTSDLQAELQRRRRQLPRLAKRRAKLLDQLKEVDAQIADLGGAAGKAPRAGVGRKRPKNAKPLAEVMLKVMSKSKAMGVSDIAAAVKKAGYKSNAANFTSIVNQALIKDKRFKQASRGKYLLK